MATRWFVVPRIGTGSGGDPYRPKYADMTGITKFSGQWLDFSAQQWSDLPWYPEPMYIVRFYADTTKPLNDVENQSDAWSERDASHQEIASYLNERFDRSRSYDEWTARFTAGGV